MRALFLFLICFVTVSDAVAGCGERKTSYSTVQHVDDKEFLYTSKAAYDELAKLYFRDAQNKSHTLLNGALVYECDPAALRKSLYCGYEVMVLAEPGWVHNGQEIKERTLFICSVRDENNDTNDTWIKVSMIDGTESNAGVTKYAFKKKSVYNHPEMSCLYSSGGKQAVCEGVGGGKSVPTAPVTAVCVKNTIRQVGCVNIPNAAKCTETCVDGMKWEFLSLDSCQNGWSVDGDTCVQDKTVGAVCPQDEWPQYAAEGKWNSSGTCYATKCNDKTLLVVDANGNNQGWCVGKTYCQSQKKLDKECKLKVIDGTKTDLTCECPEQEGGEESKENKECDPKDLPDGATKGTYDKDGMCHATECAEWKKKLFVDLKRMTCTDVSQCETSVFVKAGLDKKVTDDMFLDGENVENAEKYLVSDEYCFVYKCKDGFKSKENKCVAVGNNAPQGQGTGGDSNDGNNSGGNDAKGKDANGKDANGAPATKKTPADGTVCTPTVADKNVKAWHYKAGVCVPRDCIDGFEVKNDKCTAIAGDCETLPENAVRAHRKWDTKQKKILCLVDECKSKYVPADDNLRCIQDIEKLTQERDEARAREQSTANKLIGAAGIGAGGIGGMMLASGMAEQNADADAETAMKAYLATFHCNYGDGKNIPGGTENVELPGGNELIGLYTEYVTLANDLKARKADLGMQPGIESEAILESATSGLYDDVATGKTSGAYASLARALMDPEGEDAKTWAAQKEESAKNVKTGAITAGVGAGGSLIGNMIVNRDTYKTPKNDKDKDK